MEAQFQITSRHLTLSDDIADAIRQECAKLQRFYPRIMGCRVLVDAEHRFATGDPIAYGVRIDLTVPQGELPATRQRDPVLWSAVQRAFDAAQRQLEDFARVQRGDTSPRENPPKRATVRKLLPWEGYGFLETGDGREIYFHRNSVRNGTFDQLEVGAPVRFREEEGDQGPQATMVTPA